LSTEAPAANRPVPKTALSRTTIRNESEASTDATPAEIITIKVISGFTRTMNDLKVRVSGFDSLTLWIALAVKISLLALIDFTSGPMQFALTRLFGFALLFVRVVLCRAPAPGLACAAFA
jgi:hypothetical protein